MSSPAKHLNSSDNIKLLAFLAMCKKYRGNSVLFIDKMYKMANHIGMSDGRTFKKYFEKAITARLITIDNNRCFAIKWQEAAVMMLQLTEKQAKWFDKPFREANTFKQFERAIEKRILGVNYKSQQKHIDKKTKNKISSAQTVNNFLKAVKGKAVSKSKSRKRNVKCNPNIVTGVNHMAKLIGKSPTTAKKRFDQFQLEGSLYTESIVYYYKTEKVCTQEMINVMNECRKKKGGLILPTSEGYKQIMGKKVMGFNFGLYKYNGLTACGHTASGLTAECSSTLLPNGMGALSS
jgi:hypothetical protein